MRLTHARTVKDFKAAIQGRLQALSNAHSLLAQSRWAGADLRSLVMEELAPYRVAGKSRANISGPTLVLEPKAAQTIAMVLHELTTNAVEYGALSVPSGRLPAWWFRGTFERARREGFQSIIDGRDAQIAGLNMQIAVAQERLRLANDLQEYASTKFSDAEKERRN